MACRYRAWVMRSSNGFFCQRSSIHYKLVMDDTRALMLKLLLIKNSALFFLAHYGGVLMRDHRPGGFPITPHTPTLVLRHCHEVHPSKPLSFQSLQLIAESKLLQNWKRTNLTSYWECTVHSNLHSKNNSITRWFQQLWQHIFRSLNIQEVPTEPWNVGTILWHGSWSRRKNWYMKESLQEL